MRTIFKIYKLTNLIKNKVYIGQTTLTVEERFYYHLRKDSGCMYIRNSIQKYGSHNFKIEWIATSLTKEYTQELEQYFIDLFNTMAPNGYNLQPAGKPVLFDLSVKERMSKSQKERHEKSTVEEKLNQTKGIISYVEQKKRPILGVNNLGETIQFDTISSAEDEGFFPCNSLKNSYDRSNGYIFYYLDEHSPEEILELASKSHSQHELNDEISKVTRTQAIRDSYENKPERRLVAVHPYTNDIKYYRNQNDAYNQGISSSSLQGSLHSTEEVITRSKGYHFFYEQDYTLDQMFEIALQKEDIIKQRLSNGRKLAVEHMQDHIESQKKAIIGINPKTLEYKTFKSLAEAYSEGYSGGGISPGIRGEKRTSKGLHFQHFTKSIPEHIEFVKNLYKIK